MTEVVQRGAPVPSARFLSGNRKRERLNSVILSKVVKARALKFASCRYEFLHSFL
jgi:hypothetical protein